MKKKCTGSRSKQGCGEMKVDGKDGEFSLNYPNMCKKCENKLSRIRYHKREKPKIDNTAFSELLSMPWRQS